MKDFSKIFILIAAGACVWFFYGFKDQEAKVVADSDVAAVESIGASEISENAIIEEPLVDPESTTKP